MPKTCFYGTSEHVYKIKYFLHWYTNNLESPRTMMSQVSCLLNKVHWSYDALFRSQCSVYMKLAKPICKYTILICCNIISPVHVWISVYIIWLSGLQNAFLSPSSLCILLIFGTQVSNNHTSFLVSAFKACELLHKT